MYHLIKDRKNLVFFVLGFLFSLILFFTASFIVDPKKNTKELSFLVDNACIPYLENNSELFEVFDAELIKLNYRFNGYDDLKYTVRLYHRDLGVMEGFVNKILNDCRVTSTASFNIFDDISVSDFIFYVKKIIKEKRNPIILEVKNNTFVVKSNDR